MEKLLSLLKKLGIELTADQTKQLKEVIDKEFVTAEAAAADKTKLEELTKQHPELRSPRCRQSSDADLVLFQRVVKLFSQNSTVINSPRTYVRCWRT